MIERRIDCIDALTPAGWSGPVSILIDGQGRISGVERLDTGAGSSLHGPLLPGMPNLHSHAFQRVMAGATESSLGKEDHFWSWRDAMYRVANRIDPDQFQAIAAWVQAEMLEAGYTSCAEFHYLHHQCDGKPYDDPAEMIDRLLQAAEDTGIALTVLPVLYCRNGFRSHAVSEHQRRFFNTPDSFMQLLAECERKLAPHLRHRLGWAPHSLRAVAQDQLAMVLAVGVNRGGPVHIHIAEQSGEVEECLAVHGTHPVEFLLQNFPVNEQWTLVHATHLSDAELRVAAKSGAVAGLCPTTEADLGDGFFEAGRWLAHGGKFGIGSDSNLRISVNEELRLLESGCRLRERRRNVLVDEGRSCGRSLFQRAVEGGAASLSQPVGRIEVGWRADLVELDAGHVLLSGRRDDMILDTWIFAGDASMVRSVWVAGELCVAEGRHLERDRLAVRFKRVMEELA